MQLNANEYNGPLPLRYIVGAVLSRRYAARMDTATSYQLRCNAVSFIIKI